MHRAVVFIAVLALLGLAIYLGCSPDAPTIFDRPPLVTGFAPESQELDAFVGDTLMFALRGADPDRDPLHQYFTLGDSVVSGGLDWMYIVEDTGSVTVRAIITDGANESTVSWQLMRHKRINFAPQIIDFNPVESTPFVIVGTAIEFAVGAVDEDEDELTYRITVDDSLVTTEDRYTHVPGAVGEQIIQVVVTDGEGFASHSWLLQVTAVPDTILPALVEIVDLQTGDRPGELKLSWIAVGKDGMEGVASEYLVRTSAAAIVDELSWIRGSERVVLEPPASPGEVMEMVVGDLIPARYTYVAVRAVDDFGNLSPLGASPGEFARGMHISGTVVNAVTSDPIEDVTVRLSIFQTQTTADGRWDLFTLPPAIASLQLSDDNQQGVVGAFFDFDDVYEVIHDDDLKLALIPNLSTETNLYPEFLTFFTAMTQTPGMNAKRAIRRWVPPIDVYVPPFAVSDSSGVTLDYRKTILEVIDEYNAMYNIHFFNVVPSVPIIGVNFEYQADLAFDNYRVVSQTASYQPYRGRVRLRTVYVPATNWYLRVVVRHELGHAVGLNHSIDARHLMIGGQSPSAQFLTPDEVAAMHALYGLPRNLKYSSLIWE